MGSLAQIIKSDQHFLLSGVYYSLSIAKYWSDLNEEMFFDVIIKLFIFLIIIVMCFFGKRDFLSESAYFYSFFGFCWMWDVLNDFNIKLFTLLDLDFVANQLAEVYLGKVGE